MRIHSSTLALIVALGFPGCIPGGGGYGADQTGFSPAMHCIMYGPYGDCIQWG